MKSIRLTEALREPAPAAQWRARLAAAGLTRPVPVEDSSDWSPFVGMLQIQEALLRLEAAEAAEAEAAPPIALPNALWMGVGLALLVLILFAEVLLAILGHSVLIGGMVLAISTAAYTLFDRRRRKASVAVHQATHHLQQALDALLSRNFVAWVGGLQIESTPDLARLCLLEEALRISDPSAPLLQELQDDIKTFEAECQSMTPTPGAGWSDIGLHTDIQAMQERIDQMG